MTTDTNQLEELKPCPFCGSDAPDARDFRVRCDGCGSTSAWQPAQELAIAAWNRRSQTASDLAGEVERLRGALKPFAERWDALRDPLPQGPFTLVVDAMDCCRARAALQSKEG